MLVTLTHPIPGFTGVVTVLEKYVLPFNSGTASIDLDPAAFSAVENAGIALVIGAQAPAPPYDSNLDAVVAPIVTSAASDTTAALRAAFAARPAGGADGQVLVKSGTDTAWATVAGGTGAAAADPVLSNFSYDPTTGNLLSYQEDGVTITLTYNADGTVATSKRGSAATKTFTYSGGNLAGVA